MLDLQSPRESSARATRSIVFTWIEYRATARVASHTAERGTSSALAATSASGMGLGGSPKTGVRRA
jgi:hypothetical protein